jgi:phospholipid/cholesterol/gamma-HCH transport system ATP-binding protein
VALFVLRDLRKRFNGRTIFDGLDLDIHRGEVLTIIGESGSGKSILLKTILGIVTSDEGTITFDGEVISSLPERRMIEVRRRIGMLFQESALFDSLSVFDNVAYGLREQRRMGEAQIRERVSESLRLVGLGGIEALWPTSLSGGMKKRVALARAVAVHPEVVFYDEPTEGLDPINVTRVNRLMLGLRRSLSVTTVVVTHNLRSAFAVSDRLAMIHQGKVIHTGTPESFRRSTDARIKGFIGGALEAMDRIGEAPPTRPFPIA